mmetsp:Transcript_32259/g.80799  ORF Transcript_32259/g.80799 Transcript_32259/m.80799 type:complete len:341 (+) Transcript_32259:3-1025(+)
MTEFIFTEDRPAPHRNCHASTLVTLPDGTVVAAWFGGHAEKNPDVGIWASRRPAGGEWEPAFLVAKIEEVAHWNPVLFQVPSEPERIYLHFKVGSEIFQWSTYATHSDDAFHTWAQPQPLVAGDVGGRGCVKDKPLVLRDGAILCGASVEPRDSQKKKMQWRAFVDRSEDSGATWEATPLLEIDDEARPDAWLIQPTLWQSDAAGRRVHALLRSDAGSVFRADSEDGGRTWGKAYRTKLPNNNSGIDAARMPDGALLLAHNPVGGDWGARWPLRLSMSVDNGETWPCHLDLDAEEGEFSYPAIIPWQGDAPGFRLTYTWNRTNIRFLSMSMQDFTGLCTA